MTFRFTIPASLEVGELKLNHGDSLLQWDCAERSWSLELGRKHPLSFKLTNFPFFITSSEENGFELKIGNGAEGTVTNYVKFWFDDDASEQLVRLFKLVLADIGQRLVDARIPGMTTEGGTFVEHTPGDFLLRLSRQERRLDPDVEILLRHMCLYPGTMKHQLPDRIRAWAALLAGGQPDRLYFFDDEGDQVVLDDTVDSFGEAMKIAANFGNCLHVVVESNGHDYFDHLDDEDSQSDVGSIDFVEAMEETPAVAGEDGVLQSMEAAVDDRISRMFESVASSQEDDAAGIPVGVAEFPPHSSNQSTISEFEMLDADEVDQQLDANAGSVRNSALESPVASRGSMTPIGDHYTQLVSIEDEPAEAVQPPVANVDSSPGISLIEFSNDGNGNGRSQNENVIVQQPLERPVADVIMSSSFGFSMVPQVPVGSVVIAEQQNDSFGHVVNHDRNGNASENLISFDASMHAQQRQDAEEFHEADEERYEDAASDNNDTNRPRRRRVEEQVVDSQEGHQAPPPPPRSQSEPVIGENNVHQGDWLGQTVSGALQIAVNALMTAANALQHVQRHAANLHLPRFQQFQQQRHNQQQQNCGECQTAEEAITRLVDMGFYDITRLENLLIHHSGNVQAVVNDLLVAPELD